MLMHVAPIKPKTPQSVQGLLKVISYMCLIYLGLEQMAWTNCGLLETC